MTDKASLRKQTRSHREKLAAVMPGYGAAIAALAHKLPGGSDTLIGGYAALKGEADPALLLQALHANGVALALPRVAAKDDALVFHRWQPGDALQTGSFGVAQPLDSAPVVLPNVLLVPLLAYDSKGNRLGYGGGYYDRTLERLKVLGNVLTIGVAFANQEIPSVPQEAHDARLDMILTESGLRRFLP